MRLTALIRRDTHDESADITLINMRLVSARIIDGAEPDEIKRLENLSLIRNYITLLMNDQGVVSASSLHNPSHSRHSTFIPVWHAPSSQSGTHNPSHSRFTPPSSQSGTQFALPGSNKRTTFAHQRTLNYRSEIGYHRSNGIEKAKKRADKWFHFSDNRSFYARATVQNRFRAIQSGT